MVEDREIPGGDRGHFRYNMVNAYGSIVPPTNGEYSLTALVGQQVGGIYIASLGRPPQWFGEGVGAVIGLQMDYKDPRLKAGRKRFPRVLASGAEAGRLPHPLACRRGKRSALDGIRQDADEHVGQVQFALEWPAQGDDFENAFRRAYGTTPAQAAMYLGREKIVR